MKPAPFTYHRPADLDSLVATMADLGDEAKLLAGGQSLVPLLALRLASPTHLVDMTRVLDLRAVDVHEAGESADAGYLVVGANATQRDVELDLRIAARVPLLADALPLIAHPQIRNRGTVCGSIAHADPAAELPAVALALDARIVVRSARGTRRIDASDFFLSYLETALEPDDVVVAVEFPLAAPHTGAAFHEISRRHGDFAMAGVAASLTLDHDGRIDLVVTQVEGPTRLFLNQRARSGLRVVLEGPASNPDGIGAQVRVQFQDGREGPVRAVQGGSGFGSQDSAAAVLGVPTAPKAVWVHWPGGKIQIEPVTAGQTEVKIRSGKR